MHERVEIRLSLTARSSRERRLILYALACFVLLFLNLYFEQWVTLVTALLTSNRQRLHPLEKNFLHILCNSRPLKPYRCEIDCFNIFMCQFST